jgi:hypothetical protein
MTPTMLEAVLRDILPLLRGRWRRATAPERPAPTPPPPGTAGGGQR